jgi:hypothetical protein
VSDHDHGDLLLLIEIDQNLHNDISRSSVKVTSWLIKQQDFGLV